jgi:hypothetical protein
VKRVQSQDDLSAGTEWDDRLMRLRGDIMATRMRVNVVADAVASQKRAFDRIFRAND